MEALACRLTQFWGQLQVVVGAHDTDVTQVWNFVSTMLRRPWFRSRSPSLSRSSSPRRSPQQNSKSKPTAIVSARSGLVREGDSCQAA